MPIEIPDALGTRGNEELHRTQREVAIRLGLTHQRVDQLERATLRKLWRLSPPVLQLAVDRAETPCDRLLALLDLARLERLRRRLDGLWRNSPAVRARRVG